MSWLSFRSVALRLSFSVLLACATTAFSQATFPSPVLTSVFPLGGSAGATVKLTLSGSEVDDVSELLLDERSIPVELIKGKDWRVMLPADLKAGFYDLRIVGSLGVSNPRKFEISEHDTLISNGKNTEPARALKVPLNTVIDGVFKVATPQWFSFEAKTGQSILVSSAPNRFDVRSELAGTVLNASGRELARMKNGAALFACPADGTYLLRLNELMHRGGDDYGFRVHLRVSDLESSRVSSGSQPTSPIPVKIGDVIEGNFPEADEPRVFELPMKAGDKFVVEVRSHQLGHPSDPHLFVETLKPDGTASPLVQVADAPAITPAPTLAVANRDPVYAHEAKAEGRLRISLNDTFNTTSRFELGIRPAPGSAPRLIALHATLPPAAARKGYEVGTANVCRGGILALEVIAPNRHALSDAIEVKADGQKMPEGLTCLGGFIGKGQSLGYVAFQASGNAPAGAAVIDGISETAHVRFTLADAARDQLLTGRAGPPAVGVSTLPAPASVNTEGSNTFEAGADGKLDIPLKITRHADFQDALKLKVLGLVETAKAPEADIPAKSGGGKLTLDLKALKLPPGEYGFILQGPAKMKYRRNANELAQAEADAKKALGEVKIAQDNLVKAEADITPQKQNLVDEAKRELKKYTEAKGCIDQRVKNLAAKAVPKEGTFIVYSNPIRLTVKAPGK